MVSESPGPGPGDSLKAPGCDRRRQRIPLSQFLDEPVEEAAGDLGPPATTAARSNGREAAAPSEPVLAGSRQRIPLSQLIFARTGAGDVTETRT